MCFLKKRCSEYKIARVISVSTLIILIMIGAYNQHSRAELRTIPRQSPAIRTQQVKEPFLPQKGKEQVVQNTQSSQKISVPSMLAPVKNGNYTQTEAFFSLPSLQKEVAKHYNIKPYQNLIDAAIGREKQFADTHYVFYHGTDNVWRVPQDLYTQLYTHFNAKVPTDFTFLRFDGVEFRSIRPKEFLVSELKKSGLINDHGAMGTILFSVNLSLFGNVGYPSECTWEYFIKSRDHLSPDRKIYEQIMNKFGLSHKYINELMSLVKTYETKEETILQIFVPKEKVDEIGYLAWVRGIPADEATIDWIEGHVKDKTFAKRQYAIDGLTDKFKKEQESNPIFRNLVQRVERDDFSLQALLKMYCNQPEKVKNINILSARLLFTHSVLLNPQSGVKVFRISTAKPEQLKSYHQRLSVIVNKLIAEKSTP